MALFKSAFLCVHIRTKPDSHILDKSFPKKFFCKGVQLYFEISLLSFIHKIFEQNFYLYITVYLVRIWTYKNADEKAHTFSRRSKNVKKRTKTYEKRVLCKFTLSSFFCSLSFIAKLNKLFFQRNKNNLIQENKLKWKKILSQSCETF